MRLLTSFVLLLTCGLLSAQHIGHNAVDLQRLENDILKEINTLRARKSLQLLQTDSSLMLAAEDQVKYITRIQKLSHRQPSAQKAKTRSRVEYYGGHMLGVGENTAFIMLFQPAIYRAEKGRLDTLTINQYEQAKYYFVQAWLNSEVHRKNMLYEQYEYTGLKLAYDKRAKTLYAVQVFGFGKRSDDRD